MKAEAVSQASARLAKATTAVAAIASPSASIPAQEAAWIDFLLAFVGVYNKLQHGAKDSPPSRQWFGKKKTERAKDPLLSYLHQARNADEHGLESSTAARAKSLTVPTRGRVKFTAREGGVWDWTPIVGMPTANDPWLHLVPVSDERFGTIFPPPDTHLGAPVLDKTAVGVAILGLAYLRQLVSDADAISHRPGAQSPLPHRSGQPPRAGRAPRGG